MAQVSKAQKMWHEALGWALALSPAVGVLMGCWMYRQGLALESASVWAGLPSVLVFMMWIDTEVNWRKREEKMRKVLARMRHNG